MTLRGGLSGPPRFSWSLHATDRQTTPVLRRPAAALEARAIPSRRRLKHGKLLIQLGLAAESIPSEFEETEGAAAEARKSARISAATCRPRNETARL